MSRVASIGPLERGGVFVSSAIRPLGHVLQVTNGKGLTRAAAQAGALGEAAELLAAETVDSTRLRWGTVDEVPNPWVPASAVAPAVFGRSVRLAWVEAARLDTRGSVWVPAHTVYCPPAGAPLLGPMAFGWTSNGMGAHRDRAAAIRHALFELYERHALAEVLPLGWSAAVLRPRVVRHASRLVQRLRRSGLCATLFDVSPHGSSLPVAAALVSDGEDAAHVVPTSGYACRATPGEALDAALLEAVQSRLTEIHGARDDIGQDGGGIASELVEALAKAPEVRAAASMPRARSNSVGALVRGLSWPVACFEYTPKVGPHVVKVFSPVARTTELLS